MENFSNNRTDYWNQIKLKLLDSKDYKDFRFRYLEMGQLLTHGLSITQVDSHRMKLILKIWKADFDNKRYDKGIYNLDRLATNEKIIELNSEEVKKIDGLLNKELKLTDREGIVLDGLYCQLETEKNKLVWNSNEEINRNLIELVELLRSKAACND
jgi:hypothetical protein